MLPITGIFDLFNGLIHQQKKLKLKELPSQGVFYKDDFSIKIKKAKIEDIIEYEHNFNKENVYLVVESIKKVIKNNVVLPKGYVFEDIKSVDMIFIFLEIVKFTQNKKINISYFDDNISKMQEIEFSSKNFNYFDFSKFVRDSETAEILVDDWRFSMPSIGIENCLTYYLLAKIKEKGEDDLSGYSFDFVFFSANKNKLTFNEMENLFEIFNYDIDEKDKRKITSIVDTFMKLVGYNLKIEGKIVEIKSKIDLEKIWK